MKLYLEGVGLRGPGLPSWTEGQEILAGRSRYNVAEIVMTASPLLPPPERRRTTDTVKLAMSVGSEAISHAGVTAESTPSVFTSSGGDGKTITAILEILASPQREVSPTRFHNSVHNAPAGYWTIATQCREASTSMCAHDFSFAAGLLEAAVRAHTERCPILLVAYDVPYPPALDACRKIVALFGTAMVISPHPTANSLAELSMRLCHGAGPETVLRDPTLEALRTGVPAARALPLLAAAARAVEEEVIIAHVANNGLVVRVTPKRERHPK
jgi:hypothetical protein